MTPSSDGVRNCVPMELLIGTLITLSDSRLVTPPTRLDKSSLVKKRPPKRCKSSFRLKLMTRMLRRNSKVLEKISRTETLLSWTQLPVLQLTLPKPILILSIRLILMLHFNLKPWRLQLIPRLMICILMQL